MERDLKKRIVQRSEEQIVGEQKIITKEEYKKSKTFEKSVKENSYKKGILDALILNGH